MSPARCFQQRQFPGHGGQEVAVTEPAAQGKQGDHHGGGLVQDGSGALGVCRVPAFGEDGVCYLAEFGHGLQGDVLRGAQGEPCGVPCGGTVLECQRVEAGHGVTCGEVSRGEGLRAISVSGTIAATLRP